MVAKKYSIDPTSKNKGGLLVGVTKGQQDAALDTAAFAAPKGKVLGPVKGELASGYYVFEVTKIKQATQQTLAQATAPDPDAAEPAGANRRADRRRQSGEEELAGEDLVPPVLLDGRLPRLQGAGLHDVDPGLPRQPRLHRRRLHRRQRRRLSGTRSRGRSKPRWRGSTRSPGGCARECPWDREQDERTIVPHTRRGGLRAGRRRSPPR